MRTARTKQINNHTSRVSPPWLDLDLNALFGSDHGCMVDIGWSSGWDPHRPPGHKWLVFLLSFHQTSCYVGQGLSGTTMHSDMTPHIHIYFYVGHFFSTQSQVGPGFLYLFYLEQFHLTLAAVNVMYSWSLPEHPGSPRRTPGVGQDPSCWDPLSRLWFPRVQSRDLNVCQSSFTIWKVSQKRKVVKSKIRISQAVIL